MKYTLKKTKQLGTTQNPLTYYDAELAMLEYMAKMIAEGKVK